jgi:hypothetical protein
LEIFSCRRKHQATESSFSLGGGQQTAQHHEADGSLYKKSFTFPAIEPCPAAVLHVDAKSNYQFTCELHNHRFYTGQSSTRWADER